MGVVGLKWRYYKWYLGFALLRVKDATWLFVEMTAADMGDFVELTFQPKLATSEPIEAAEVSQSDAHHRLLELRRAGVVGPSAVGYEFVYLSHSH